MTEIALSRRQAHDTDRLGGIELAIVWPAELGEPPALARNERRVATGAVQTWARRALARAIEHHGLAVLYVQVASLYVPEPRDRQSGWRPVIAVHLVAERYAEASSGRHGVRYFAETSHGESSK